MKVAWMAGMVLCMLLAGCTDAADEPGTPPGHSDGDGTGGESHVIDVESFSFSKTELTIAVGDTVVFQFKSGTHTATADNGEFDSGSRSAPDTFSWTAEQAGTVPFHCSFHASMTGTITVE